MIGILLAGVGIVVVLIATSGGDNNTSSDVVPPTPTVAPVTPAPTGAPSAKQKAKPKATAKANAKAKPAPAAQVQRCDPIFGGGTAYAVTSSAKAGASPASCSEAHSVLLTALNDKTASVGKWRCAAQPNGATLASCRSGSRTLAARG